jgi:hypothetical protein
MVRVVRDDRDRRALGLALAPPAGCRPTGSRSCARATKCFPWEVAGRFLWVEVPATRNGSGRTSSRCLSWFVAARSTRSWLSACRSPTRGARTSCSRARRRRESSCSCPKPAEVSQRRSTPSRSSTRGWGSSTLDPSAYIRIVTERPHFFFGQVIGVDDLEQEQLYHRPHPHRQVERRWPDLGGLCRDARRE